MDHKNIYKNVLHDAFIERLEMFNINKKYIEDYNSNTILQANGNCAAILFCKNLMFNDGSEKFYEKAIDYINNAIINQLEHIDTIKKKSAP
jgi:hypothetical protein